jgi:elongation factor Ts
MSQRVEQIKTLREKTGLGVIECQKALESAGGDIEKAVEFLRQKGLRLAEKKTDKATKEGLIGSYVHSNGKIGVLVEVACESDFVARTDDFQELVKNICLQVAATNPRWITREDIPAEVLDEEKRLVREQYRDKPENIRDKIVEGKINDFCKETVLVEQVFIRDDSMTIGEYLKGKIAKLGENIRIMRMARFQIGE